MFELRNITKRYGATEAVSRLDLATSPGKTTVLIGPSGCGKSTLLRVLIGLVTPDAGAVFFDGDRVTAENAVPLRRKMGYVIQDGGLFPHLSARRNVTLLARQLKWDRERVAMRVAELAELTQFPTTGLDRFPAELSGGQRQRVSLMRALMLDPKVLLLDEPLGALDPMIRNQLQQDLRDIFQRLGKTVVMVTHDLGEAAFFSDTIVLMREGSVAQTGRFRDLRGAPASDFVTEFVNAQRGLFARDGTVAG